jgi:mannosylglycerate hydrolase
MSLQLIVVPHTHWDREWFYSFETFRFHLVEFMDDLIQSLEDHRDIPCFLLDGQMILIEDYLDLRPLMRERLEKLTRAGRISLGPWYVQPDEFQVGGESLIKNLEIGIEQASRWGKPMLQGYVPDTFGHIAQLPQILNGFGIKTFYFMRGFGEDLEKTGAEFSWQGLDGSELAALFLSESYSNGAVIGADPESTALHHGTIVNYNSLDELVSRMEKRSHLPALLLLNGSDHTLLQKELAKNAASLSAVRPLRLGSLDEIGELLLAAQKDLPLVRGELRFGRYYSVCKDVVSSRIYLKQLNTRAEETILLAERFNGIAALLGGSDNSAFLLKAWKELVKNQAHDSICGCSSDQVHREMVLRYNKAINISAAVKDAALEELALGIGPADTEDSIPLVVFNPSPWERSGYCEARIIPLKTPPLGERDFGHSSASRDFDPSELVILDDAGNEIPFECTDQRTTIRDITLRRKVLFEDCVRFYAASIPPMGYRIYRILHSLKKKSVQEKEDNASQRAGEASLDNGLVKATMHSDGTISVEDHSSGISLKGLHYFIDEGEAGDEYTQSPFPRPDVFSSKDLKWTVSRQQNSLIGRCGFPLPPGAGPDRQGRAGEALNCSLSVQIDLYPGERLLRFRTVFDNRCKDHRLRVCFPTGIDAEDSTAESAFGLVNRPVQPEPCEDFWEKTSANNVQRRFMFFQKEDQGFALFNKGLPEYELMPGGTLHLSLLRAIGWLSRGDLIRRPGQAGPPFPCPDAQCLGEHVFEYGIYLFRGAVEKEALFRIAEEFHHPLDSVGIQTKKTPRLKPMGKSFCCIDNPRILMSSMKIQGPALLVRVYNPFTETENFTVSWDLPLAEVSAVSLGGKTERNLSFDQGSRGFRDTLKPGKIASYRIFFI